MKYNPSFKSNSRASALGRQRRCLFFVRILGSVFRQLRVVGELPLQEGVAVTHGSSGNSGSVSQELWVESLPLQGREVLAVTLRKLSQALRRDPSSLGVAPAAIHP